MITKIIYIYTFLVVCISTTSAQENTAGRFLYVQPSPRANAMGGSAVAMENSSYEGYNNPALLAFSSKFSISGSWQNPLPIFDQHHVYGTASVRINREQAINLSVNIHSVGTFGRIYENGTLGGKFNSNSSMLSVGYAYLVNSRLSVGTSIGLVRINAAPTNAGGIGSGSATSVLFNAGVLYRNLMPEATFANVEFDSAYKTLTQTTEWIQENPLQATQPVPRQYLIS